MNSPASAWFSGPTSRSRAQRSSPPLRPSRVAVASAAAHHRQPPRSSWRRSWMPGVCSGRGAPASRGQPSPWATVFVESFHDKFRDECLGTHWFRDLPDAHRWIEPWQADYNTVRPHQGLGNRTPAEYPTLLDDNTELESARKTPAYRFPGPASGSRSSCCTDSAPPRQDSFRREVDSSVSTCTLFTSALGGHTVRVLFTT